MSRGEREGTSQNIVRDGLSRYGRRRIRIRVQSRPDSHGGVIGYRKGFVVSRAESVLYYKILPYATLRRENFHAADGFFRGLVNKLRIMRAPSRDASSFAAKFNSSCL